MNQLYPIIRRVRRPLLPAEEVPSPGSSRREEAPSSLPRSESLVTSAAMPALVKVEDAFTEAEQRKGKPGGKAAA